MGQGAERSSRVQVRVCFVPLQAHCRPPPPLHTSPFYTKWHGLLLPSGQSIRLKYMKPLKQAGLGFNSQGVFCCWCCCCWCSAGAAAGAAAALVLLLLLLLVLCCCCCCSAGDAVAAAAGSGAGAARVQKILGFKDCRINYEPMNYHRNAIKIHRNFMNI